MPWCQTEAIRVEGILGTRDVFEVIQPAIRLVAVPVIHLEAIGARAEKGLGNEPMHVSAVATVPSDSHGWVTDLKMGTQNTSGYRTRPAGLTANPSEVRCAVTSIEARDSSPYLPRQAAEERTRPIRMRRVVFAAAADRAVRPCQSATRLAWLSSRRACSAYTVGVAIHGLDVADTTSACSHFLGRPATAGIHRVLPASSAFSDRQRPSRSTAANATTQIHGLTPRRF